MFESTFNCLSYFKIVQYQTLKNVLLILQFLDRIIERTIDYHKVSAITEIRSISRESVPMQNLLFSNMAYDALTENFNREFL